MRIILLLCAVSMISATGFAESTSSSQPLSEAQLKDQQRGRALLNRINSRHPRFSLIGVLERDSSGNLSVNGELISLNPETRIEGELTAGMPVSVHGFIEGGQKVARVIQPGPPVTAGASTAGKDEALILDSRQAE